MCKTETLRFPAFFQSTMTILSAFGFQCLNLELTRWLTTVKVPYSSVCEVQMCPNRFYIVWQLVFFRNLCIYILSHLLLFHDHCITGYTYCNSTGHNCTFNTLSYMYPFSNHMFLSLSSHVTREYNQ